MLRNDPRFSHLTDPVERAGSRINVEFLAPNLGQSTAIVFRDFGSVRSDPQQSGDEANSEFVPRHARNRPVETAALLMYLVTSP